MSEAKFTKGEWKVDYDNCDYGGGEWYVIGNAKVEFSYRATTEEREEAKANAHLIAAAPEMYDMLHSIENDVNQIPPFLWDKIQDVLKKARGEK